MSQYLVPITNGAGSHRLPTGRYNVTAQVTGYNGALDPTVFTATSSPGSKAFTIAATGTLTLNINETGAEGGTAVKAGTFIRCNKDGSATYGTEKTVSAAGVCTFDHVPFGTVGTPATFYVKQLTSDDIHNIYSGVITVSMADETQSQYVQNTLAATQSFTLADAYYSGLNVDGSLTFDGPQA